MMSTTERLQITRRWWLARAGMVLGTGLLAACS